MLTPCLLCCEESEIWIMPPCNHKQICWKCCLKLVEGSIFSCPFCKVQPAPHRTSPSLNLNCSLSPQMKWTSKTTNSSCKIALSEATYQLFLLRKIQSTITPIRKWLTSLKPKPPSTAFAADRCIKL